MNNLELRFTWEDSKEEYRLSVNEKPFLVLHELRDMPRNISPWVNVVYTLEPINSTIPILGIFNMSEELSLDKAKKTAEGKVISYFNRIQKELLDIGLEIREKGNV